MFRWLLCIIAVMIFSAACLAAETVLPGPFQWEIVQDDNPEILGDEWINMFGAVAVVVNVRGEMFLCAEAELDALTEVGAHCQTFQVVKKGWWPNITGLIPVATIAKGSGYVCELKRLVEGLQSDPLGREIVAQTIRSNPTIVGLENLNTELRLVYQPKC